MAGTHPDQAEYGHFTRRQRVDKAIHTLAGLLHGIAIDNQLNAKEIAELLNWCEEYRSIAKQAPFNELIPKLTAIMKDGVIDPEEQEELLWVCKNMSPEGGFYDGITHDIQRLQGIFHGIMADGHITVEEANELQAWIDTNDHLKGVYPYDELDSLLISVLADGKIDPDEQALLGSFFEDFVEYSFAKRMKKEGDRVRAGLPIEFTLPGICATCPDISFNDKTFTFTGGSERGARARLKAQVEKRGGQLSEDVTSRTEFLVVGSKGNPCWAFACYGKKVEKAMRNRKKGQRIMIVHESDFWDAVADAGE